MSEMTQDQMTAMEDVLGDVHVERQRQHARWGEQSLPNGTGRPKDSTDALYARIYCDRAAKGGWLTYRHIAEEEIAEAFAESDPVKLRAELIQAQAVLCQWVEALDRAALAAHAPASSTNAADEGQGEGARGIEQQEGGGCVHLQTGVVVFGWAYCVDCGEKVQRDGWDANGSPV